MAALPLRHQYFSVLGQRQTCDFNQHFLTNIWNNMGVNVFLKNCQVLLPTSTNGSLPGACRKGGWSTCVSGPKVSFYHAALTEWMLCESYCLVNIRSMQVIYAAYIASQNRIHCFIGGFGWFLCEWPKNVIFTKIMCFVWHLFL